MTRLLAVVVLACPAALAAQELLASHQRGQAKRMLSTIKSAIKEHYYDPAYRGIDIEAHFRAAEAKLDAARSLSHAYGIIAQALISFDDSHTFFVPPMDATSVEYGWEIRMVGDSCYVTAVRPGSDAEAKGLTAGDRVLRVEQYVPTRHDLWKLRYLLYTLSRRTMVRMVVQAPGAPAPRTLEMASRVTKHPKVVDVDIDRLGQTILNDSREARTAQNRFGRAGTVGIWRLSGFAFDPSDVDRMMDEATEDATALVIDMRGNGGGLVKTLEEVAGRLFDRDVRIGDVRTRKSSKPLVAKTRRSPFTGRLAVLIDSDSASAAEILARLVQIEKRGIVIGDRSAGAVMQGQIRGGALEGAGGLMFYFASVTDAELVMSDGASLEKRGVVPDELLLPTGADMAAGRDPALARAVALLGGSLDPADAGAMFPVEWK